MVRETKIAPKNGTGMVQFLHGAEKNFFFGVHIMSYRKKNFFPCTTVPAPCTMYGLMVRILLIRTIFWSIFGAKLALFLVQNLIFYGAEMV